jgi:hypothetical protein
LLRALQRAAAKAPNAEATTLEPSLSNKSTRSEDRHKEFCGIRLPMTGQGPVHQHGSSGSEVAGNLSANFPGNTIDRSLNAFARGQFLHGALRSSSAVQITSLPPRLRTIVSCSRRRTTLIVLNRNCCASCSTNFPTLDAAAGAMNGPGNGLCRRTAEVLTTAVNSRHLMSD